jgi:hypothetical protein
LIDEPHKSWSNLILAEMFTYKTLFALVPFLLHIFDPVCFASRSFASSANKLYLRKGKINFICLIYQKRMAAAAKFEPGQPRQCEN